MATKITLNNNQLTENEAGAVVGTLSITPPPPLASLSLSALNGSNGFRLDGTEAWAPNAGISTGAGDVNGDGFSDILIGAYYADPEGKDGAGESYVVFGKSSGFSASLDLSSLNGNNGFRLDGVDGFDWSGRSVSSAGDVNGDGYGDIIIGANGAYPDGFDDIIIRTIEGDKHLSELSWHERSSISSSFWNEMGPEGASYVVFGKSSGFSASLDLSSLNGNNGFRLDGADENDQSGWPVSNAGDVNGDGYGDIIIGAGGADPYGKINAGESYVVFGKPSGFSASIDLSSLDGSNGFRLDGVSTSDMSGSSVSSAGDVNGDGYDDVIIGAPRGTSEGKDAAGETYVVFGRVSGWGSSLDLSSLNGNNGFRLDGDIGTFTGSSVSSAGDVNGDGYDDVIIGAFSADPDGKYEAGESYVVFGKSSGFSASIDLSSLDGSNGFRLDGVDANDKSGYSVSSAGDVNGDGYDDVIIGAHSAGDPLYGLFGNKNDNTGESYVVFGKPSGFSASLDLSSLDGSTGFRLDGVDANDHSGMSVSSAGDVNGDGYDDVIIGASLRKDFVTTNTSYVVFGSQKGSAALPPTYTLSLSGTNSSQFEIDSQNRLKLKDSVISDYETQPSYSITLTATDLDGLTYNENFTINVTNVEETLYGTPVNDILDGFSGYDIIDGGDGLDTAKYSVASDAVSFSANDSDQLVIEDSFEHSETLVDVERIQFTDKAHALDLDGNAGVAAKAIVASFGADSLNAYMSAALSVVDGGASLESLCDLVVETKLIDQLTGSSSNSSFVGHLFKNVVGRSPNLLENALYTTQLDNGTYTKSSLLALAANTTLTEALVTANSVDLIGVAGSADGEILALQYDIGLG
jgi:hypothetical protein